jgi:hypothetical protein
MGITARQEVQLHLENLARDYQTVDAGLSDDEALEIAALDFKEEMKEEMQAIKMRFGLTLLMPCPNPAYVDPLETAIWEPVGEEQMPEEYEEEEA